MADISRRSFLTGAAATAAGAAAAMGFSGCGSSTGSSTDGGPESSTAASGSADAHSAEMGVSGHVASEYAIAPVAVADAGDPARECDYLVIGAGNCGMMSAAYAASLGLNTIVLEKTSTTGGSSVGTEVTMAVGENDILKDFAADADVVNLSQEPGSADDVYTYFMMHNSWEANAELVSNYVKNNYRVHDFLYENGGRPMMLLPSLDAPTNGIMYVDQGTGAFNVMQSTAEKYGAEILLSSPATALVMDGGTVVGAMAAVDGGDEVYIKAKAVFVGSGGFSNNTDLLSAYIPWGDITWRADSFLAHDGDGILMMLGAGAVASDLTLAQPAGSSVEGATWESAVDKAAREPYLWVNATGARLGNEKWTVMDTTYKVGIKEPPHTYFNIIDTAAAERMQTESFLTSARTVLGSVDPVSDMVEQLDAGVEQGLFYKADTLEDLAAAAGTDADGLKATVEHYNELVAAGEDTEFFKDPTALFSIEKAPFYAFKMIPSWYSTLCGVKINGNIQVTDEDGMPIPGLYAGGLDSGDFFMDNYNHGFSGGCSGYSYFTGFFGAEKAKEYIDAL